MNNKSEFSDEVIIRQISSWISSVVIGCNFCPFAGKPFGEGKVSFVVNRSDDPAIVLESLINECNRLDEDENIETILMILPENFADFEEYLDLLDIADQLLEEQEYEGIYQLASFHPEYIFEDADENDPANYTNRSPYPILQLLREESVEQVLRFYPDPESIPEKNINFARKKGLLFMQQLLTDCY